MDKQSAGFNEFMQSHEPRLKRFVQRMVGSVEDAEDISQEALMRVYRTRERTAALAVDTVEGGRRGNLRSWLFTIARNLSIDHLRRKREKAVPSEEIAREASRAPTPESIYERQVEIQLLRKSLKRLPEHYSEILELRFSEGLSYKGIAKKLGVPMTTVEARLHRARRMLRRVLGELLDA